MPRTRVPPEMAGIFARPPPASGAQVLRAYAQAILLLAAGCAAVVFELLLWLYRPSVSAGFGPGGLPVIAPAALEIFLSAVWISRIRKGFLAGEPPAGPPSCERF
jgi:hypothetical protein